MRRGNRNPMIALLEFDPSEPIDSLARALFPVSSKYQERCKRLLKMIVERGYFTTKDLVRSEGDYYVVRKLQLLGLIRRRYWGEERGRDVFRYDPSESFPKKLDQIAEFWRSIIYKHKPA